MVNLTWQDLYHKCAAWSVGKQRFSVSASRQVGRERKCSFWSKRNERISPSSSEMRTCTQNVLILILISLAVLSVLCTFYVCLPGMLQLMLLMTVQRSNEYFIVWCLLEDDGWVRSRTVKSIAPLKVQSTWGIFYDLFVSGNIICEECESDT